MAEKNRTGGEKNREGREKDKAGNGGEKEKEVRQGWKQEAG